MAKYFPMYTNLKNTVAIIIGNNKKADGKAKKIASYVERTVFINEYFIEFDLLKKYESSVVIVADESLTDVEKLFDFCINNKIPINTVDNKEYCTFIFPSIITNGKLTVAVSTDGASPAFAVRMKKDIDSLIPSNTDEILDWLEDLRPKLNGRKEIDNTLLPAIYKELIDKAFELERPLIECETEEIIIKISGE